MSLRRREFIAGLGGAAAWPLSVGAQQAAVPVIGVLGSGSRSTSDFALAAFAQGLRQQGFVEDRNVNLHYSWAEGHYDLLPTMAAEFVRRRVAVIVTLGGTVAAEAAKAATTTIPIVFSIGTDPVAVGLVKSLNRPGGNLTGATGMTVELTPKRLGLLHDLVPNVTRIGFLINPDNRTFIETATKEEKEAAATLGIQVHPASISSDRDFDPAFESLAQLRVGALDVSDDPFHLSRRERIVALAARYRIPAVYSSTEYVKVGGLMSYGPTGTGNSVIVGDYVGRILKGEKPADLPVQQATKVELIINMNTAKALGLIVPLTLRVRADEVIE